MKNNISELVAHSKVQFPALLDSCLSGNTKDGNLFITIVLKDTSGAIDGKIWNASIEQLEEVKSLVGKVVVTDAVVTEFKSNLQLKVASIKLAHDQIVENFITVAPVASSEMIETLNNYLFKINDSDLQRICRKLINDDLTLIQSSPAASKNHHDYYGGLIHHITSMLKLAESLKVLYPIINESLLYAGVIVHDIGKIFELSGPISTTYTLEGKLLGHISIALKMIEQSKRELNIAESESTLLLEHLLLSHHGKLEYGSPKEPVVMEAEILNYIDNLDARMVMMTRAILQTEPGEFSQRVFALENRSFYRPINSNFDDIKDN